MKNLKQSNFTSTLKKKKEQTMSTVRRRNEVGLKKIGMKERLER